MVSREHGKESIHDKLQILRSITHSHAMNESSIVLDASNYIKDLKQKVDKLNEEIATAESSARHHNSQPSMENMMTYNEATINIRVTVETLEKGYLVNIHSGQNCPGLLASILETFEELGLNVLEARVSCVDNFHLQAIGGENEEDDANMDAQTVKRAISNTIKNWIESIE
ncbi:basic helix-loop-helix (bHLH) DNA-bindingsuperfamily protein [Striga asiatica]|uniref:Basic helix-loop-helix (BHLH) DNA-bindingsuperfamily protein n=1 Tax=Striga asiatica TaxID=4170 RepID=A0A5A7R0J0_STRAF|nr:basic helix-loop-helix (bHLH) DNA-bindingsuperfamily protein [Striga asiatica]